MSMLNLLIKSLAYNDQPATANPQRRHFDWGRSIQAIPVTNPKSYPYTIPAGQTASIFSGTRTTTIDNTTGFTISQSPLLPTRYRFDGNIGTAPGLRVDRGFTASFQTYTWDLGGIPGVMALQSSTVGAFAAVQINDNLWVPGLTTGDVAGPFNALNEGMWVVVAKDPSSSVVALSRPPGSTNPGFSESVVVGAIPDALQFFSPTGVQIGDTVDISNGFFPAALQSFIVVEVTSKWFEVIAPSGLPVGMSGQPTATGMIFYSSAKRLVIVEADQEIAVQYNGDTTQLNRVSPIAPADPEQTGFEWKWGTTWSLSIVNRSSMPVNVNVLTAE